MSRSHSPADLGRGAKRGTNGRWADKKVRPAGDAEVVLWCCPTCEESGALITALDSHAERVADALAEAHKLAAPACSAEARNIRLIRPNGWTEAAAELVSLLSVRYESALPACTGCPVRMLVN